MLSMKLHPAMCCSIRSSFDVSAEKKKGIAVTIDANMITERTYVILRVSDFNRIKFACDYECITNVDCCFVPVLFIAQILVSATLFLC